MTNRSDFSANRVRPEADRQLPQELESRLRREIAELEQENLRLAVRLGTARSQLDELQFGVIAEAAAHLRSLVGRIPVSFRLRIRHALGRFRRAAGRLIGEIDQQRRNATIRVLSFAPFSSELRDPKRGVDRNGTYRLSATNGGYAYVPPAPVRRRSDVAARAASDVTFSIVSQLPDAETDLAQAAIASVMRQWHERWELILVGRTSPGAGMLSGSPSDARVRFESFSESRDKAAAVNKAIEAARGDFIVFFDSRDELTDDCLHELASRIARDDPDLIYSDEDEIAPDGALVRPFFKPDWSPDALMSSMFIGRVMCVRHSVLGRAGGLQSALDGAEEHDLALRIAEHTDSIAHIARVLYHRREVPVSADRDSMVSASRRAREAALSRRGLSGALEPVPQAPGCFRVNYRPHRSATVSIIIPTKNNAAVLERCVSSIYARTRGVSFEIVVMDNGSSDADAIMVLRALALQPRTRIHHHPKPFNYSEINNAGVGCASGDMLLFLNDDTEVLSDDWLQRLAGYAQLPHVGAVGAKLLYPGSRLVQHNGILNLDSGPAHAFHLASADEPGPFMRNVLDWNWSAVTGACLMVERAKFHAVGGFDERFPVAYNDVKLCFNLIDRGYYNVVCCAVELIHYESMSRGLDGQSPEKLVRLDRERARLYRACPTHFMLDRFHNPNLSQTGVRFELPS